MKIVLNSIVLASLLSSYPSFAQTEKFELEDLNAILAQPQINDVESLIDALPGFMKYRNSSMVIGYNTHGLLESSYEFPNLYMFGDHRSSVVVVARSKPNPLHEEETVEIMNYNRSKKSHELYEILFKKDSRPVITEHPAKCVQCHGSDSKPLWKSAYEWPGFIGSREDHINVNEFAALKALDESGNKRFKMVSKEGVSGNRQPNLRFTIRLATEHADAIANRILAHPYYFLFRKELILTLALCERPRSLVDLLGEFGINKEYWFMNQELQNNKGSGGMITNRSAFEGGRGPIEFVILSMLLERDPAIPKNLFYDIQPNKYQRIIEVTQLYPKHHVGIFSNLTDEAYSRVDPTKEFCDEFAMELGF